jgi:hypothetical protein
MCLHGTREDKRFWTEWSYHSSLRSPPNGNIMKYICRIQIFSGKFVCSFYWNLRRTWATKRGGGFGRNTDDIQRSENLMQSVKSSKAGYCSMRNILPIIMMNDLCY